MNEMRIDSDLQEDTRRMSKIIKLLRVSMDSKRGQTLSPEDQQLLDNKNEEYLHFVVPFLHQTVMLAFY